MQYIALLLGIRARCFFRCIVPHFLLNLGVQSPDQPRARGVPAGALWPSLTHKNELA
jgi:hypothetical protein